MSADNDNHFQRFQGKRVIVKMRAGESRTGFLSNAGYAMTFAPGAITLGTPEIIISTDVESMEFVRQSKEQLLDYINHSLQFPNDKKPMTTILAETGAPFTGYLEEFKNDTVKLVRYPKKQPHSKAPSKTPPTVKLFRLVEILDIKDHQ